MTAKTLPAYKKGVELIFQQFLNILKKNDTVKIDVLHKDFDPKYHEALASVPSKEPENKVVAVIKNGYMIGEKLIRPSQVAVSNGQEPEPEED